MTRGSRNNAVEKLTDHAALEKVAAEVKDAAIREPAVRKLADQAALEKIAVERAAAEKVTNQAALEEGRSRGQRRGCARQSRCRDG